MRLRLCSFLLRLYVGDDPKVVVASILSGIEYCHNEHNICHRDLKPENFLFKRPDSDTEIKVFLLIERVDSFISYVFIGFVFLLFVLCFFSDG